MRCFFRGCDSSTDRKSKFRKNGGKNHFFSPPKTEEMLQIWQNAITASGCQPNHRLLKREDRICHLHFKNEDILRSTEFKMPDGKIVSIERGTPLLKAHVVLSVFPKKVLEYAHFLGERKVLGKEHHPQEERSAILQQPSTDFSLPSHGSNESSSEVNGASLEVQNIPEAQEKLIFDQICKELSRDPNYVPLPRTGVWTLKVVNTPTFPCVVWSLWSSDSSKMRKQIFLRPDMSIDIHVDKMQVSVPELRKPETVDDVKKIVSAVDENIVPCRKATNTSSALNCPGYVWKDKVGSGPQSWRCEHCCKAEEKLKFVKICEELNRDSNYISLPLSGVWSSKVINTPDFQCIVWSLWSNDSTKVRKQIFLRPDMSIDIHVDGMQVSVPELRKPEAVVDIRKIVSAVDENIIPCRKATNTTSALNCPGYAWKDKVRSGPQTWRCEHCCKLRKSTLQKKECAEKVEGMRKKVKSVGLMCSLLRRKSIRLKAQVTKCKTKVKRLMDQCAQSDQAVLQKACSKLPETQQLSISACFSAAKVKDMRAMRYSSQWIYECILLRIKSSKTYDHLRRRKILILPTEKTLKRYIKGVSGSYGFQKTIFRVLKKKLATFNDVNDLRGMLLIDEMKLSKTLAFNRQNLRFEGFTNLGKHTPKHQLNAKGDHALVIMSQPFKGGWVQTLGCFLSKGSACGTVLHQIIIEAIILAERAGLRVDGVVTDGASWNRTMWDFFGVSPDNVSVQHIVDSGRRLWFFSDFPHLIKCLRNFFSKHGKYKIWTPDGFVSLKHWYALLEIEDPKLFNLKVNYKLTESHIKPEFYKKMNVALSFQFFHVAEAMELFKNVHPDLADCEGTIKLCRRVWSLISAMNCRTPLNSLKPGNEMWKAIESFLCFLQKWEEEAKQREFEFIASPNAYGFNVSLKAALEICTLLSINCSFQYLMTARLNQDNLERFFGLMRECCGSNDHPDSALFIQMYKLVSTYSLVKPPKGCNISGGEIIDVLLSIKDIKDADERRDQWNDKIDSILDKGRNTEVLYDAVILIDEHNYFDYGTSDYVLTYIAGFVARRVVRFANFKNENGRTAICENCSAALILSAEEEVPERHKLIYARTKGYLIHPCIRLFELISLLERGTLRAIQTELLNADTIFRVTQEIEALSPLPMIGCEKHRIQMTHSIIRFFLTTRMMLISKQSNKNDNLEKEKTKEQRKLAKLSYAPDCDGVKACYLQAKESKIATKAAKKRKRKQVDKKSHPMKRIRATPSQSEKKTNPPKSRIEETVDRKNDSELKRNYIKRKSYAVTDITNISK